MKWKSHRSKYWTLHRLSLGNCRGKEITEAKEFFTQLFSGDEEVSDKDIIRQLWRLYESESPEQLLAEKCLRCVISHYIKNQCFDLANKYDSKHNFTVEDLMPLVLDSTDSSLNHGNHNSLTIRILKTFDIKKSSLSAWVKIKVNRDRELKRFLLEHGIEQVTDWLLLKQYNSRKLQRILSDFHHLSTTEIQQYIALLKSYQNVYLAEIQAARNQINQQRKQQGLGKLTTPYLAPERQHLLSIAEQLSPRLSTDEVLEELQHLAKLIRSYRTGRRMNVETQTLHENITNVPSNTSDSSEEEDEILTVYRQLLQDCLIAAIKEVIEARVKFLQSKRKKRDKQFLEGLNLLYCQYLSMGEIATKLDLQNQSKVSRLLDLKKIRVDIGRRTLVKLRSKVLQLAQAYASPTQLKDLEVRITVFLDEEIDKIIQEAEKEVNVSKNRVMTSQLSQAICQYLDTRK